MRGGWRSRQRRWRGVLYACVRGVGWPRAFPLPPPPPQPPLVNSILTFLSSLFAPTPPRLPAPLSSPRRVASLWLRSRLGTATCISISWTKLAERTSPPPPSPPPPSFPEAKRLELLLKHKYQRDVLHRRVLRGPGRTRIDFFLFYLTQPRSGLLSPFALSTGSRSRSSPSPLPWH